MAIKKARRKSITWRQRKKEQRKREQRQKEHRKNENNENKPGEGIALKSVQENDQKEANQPRTRLKKKIETDGSRKDIQKTLSNIPLKLQEPIQWIEALKKGRGISNQSASLTVSWAFTCIGLPTCQTRFVIFRSFTSIP